MANYKRIVAQLERVHESFREALYDLHDIQSLESGAKNGWRNRKATKEVKAFAAQQKRALRADVYALMQRENELNKSIQGINREIHGGLWTIFSIPDELLELCPPRSSCLNEKSHPAIVKYASERIRDDLMRHLPTAKR